MSKQRDFSNRIRTYHRYLGFFLAGIMAVYALSGIVLIFRDTDFLKKEYHYEKQLKAGLNATQVGSEVKIKRLKFTTTDGKIATFKQGTYNIETGQVEYTLKKLPYVLDKMAHLHKAKSADPLYFLNIFFGLALLFFVVSSFWMFLPKTTIFKKGLLFTAAGLVVTLVLLFV
ncbi:PepSY domain-containing protein [Flagellimonas sp. HMM57]|uniref:PepSY domain-containing protein n=1 Tax=unclassified Flagellimonas TaxID=2644544 RepID=UPI0013D3BBC0|nr:MULTISPECIES: PepSY domain-containing protein [unclassified Flagellimonas]UII76659.1 PepSY domain-containing protein [Flagellimonas sp. HMM57]